MFFMRLLQQNNLIGCLLGVKGTQTERGCKEDARTKGSKGWVHREHKECAKGMKGCQGTQGHTRPHKATSRILSLLDVLFMSV